MNYTDDVISLYEEGFSIDYIINKIFKFSNSHNRIYKNSANQIIIFRPYVKKDFIRGQVYNIIYNYNKNKK